MHMLSGNLRKFRRASGLNQEDVSKVLGIDRSAYSYYESGKTEPSIKNLIKIARMFNIDVDTLVGNDEHTRSLVVANTAAEYNDEAACKYTSDEKAFIAWLRQFDDKNAIIEGLKQQFILREEDEE